MSGERIEVRKHIEGWNKVASDDGVCEILPCYCLHLHCCFEPFV